MYYSPEYKFYVDFGQGEGWEYVDDSNGIMFQHIGYGFSFYSENPELLEALSDYQDEYRIQQEAERKNKIIDNAKNFSAYGSYATKTYFEEHKDEYRMLLSNEIYSLVFGNTFSCRFAYTVYDNPGDTSELAFNADGSRNIGGWGWEVADNKLLWSPESWVEMYDIGYGYYCVYNDKSEALAVMWEIN